MRKIKKCVVCRLRKRVRGETLCRDCLEYYHQKYDVKNGKDLMDNDEFAEIIKLYNAEADEDDD